MTQNSWGEHDVYESLLFRRLSPETLGRTSHFAMTVHIDSTPTGHTLPYWKLAEHNNGLYKNLS